MKYLFPLIASFFALFVYSPVEAQKPSFDKDYQSSFTKFVTKRPVQNVFKKRLKASAISKSHCKKTRTRKSVIADSKHRQTVVKPQIRNSKKTRSGSSQVIKSDDKDKKNLAATLAIKSLNKKVDFQDNFVKTLNANQKKNLKNKIQRFLKKELSDRLNAFYQVTDHFPNLNKNFSYIIKNNGDVCIEDRTEQMESYQRLTAPLFDKNGNRICDNSNLESQKKWMDQYAQAQESLFELSRKEKIFLKFEDLK